MNKQEYPVKPTMAKTAIYRDMKDKKWYWTLPGFSRPVGPFFKREAAREDFRNVMGIKKRPIVRRARRTTK